jgi:predicted MFS family arabinose efflux permease
MFLLPSLALGLLLALALGGRPARLGELRFRGAWTVVVALGAQVFLFSDLAHGVPDGWRRGAHVGTYALLMAFAALNLRLRALCIVFLGMLCNAVAIVANGGEMPVSAAAGREAGLASSKGANVSTAADRLWFLGDVFALPDRLPLANVFSIGDILIGFGVVAFIVLASLDSEKEPPLRVRRIVEPLGLRDFRLLALGRLVSLTGDWLTMAALISWLYAETGSVGHVAVMLLVRLTPPILGGGLATVVVDRLPRRFLLIAVEVGRGLAVALALVGVLGGTRWLVFAAIAASGALAALSQALVPALVPALVSEERYAAANAALGMTENVAMAAGALCAGIAVAWIGVGAALALDALTFAVAALVFANLRVGAVPRPAPGAEAEEQVAAGGRLAGLRYVLGRRRLVVLVLAFAAATLATGLANASLPRLLEQGFGLGPAAYGFGFGALGAGLAAGTCAAGFTRVGAHGGRWIGAALLLMACCFALLALTAHAPTALLVLAAIGFVDGTTDVVFDTVVQNEADPRHYGSVFGFASAAYLTTMMSAVALAPFANRALAASEVMLAGCAFLAVAAAVAFAGLGGRRSAQGAARALASGAR